MLVSAICLTYNRRALLPVALRSFEAQDWPDRELLVLDDSDDAECGMELCAGIVGCRYYRVPKFRSVGEKLNAACQLAHGEIIATWDDDDWSAPNRMRDQVNRLVETGKPLTGYTTMYFYDGERAWQWRAKREDYAVGTSQVYRRSFWQAHPMPSLSVGYDNSVWNHALMDGGVSCAPGPGMMVARIHKANVSCRPHPPNTNADANGFRSWTEVPLSDLPPAFFGSLISSEMVTM